MDAAAAMPPVAAAQRPAGSRILRSPMLGGNAGLANSLVAQGAGELSAESTLQCAPSKALPGNRGWKSLHAKTSLIAENIHRMQAS